MPGFNRFSPGDARNDDSVLNELRREIGDRAFYDYAKEIFARKKSEKEHLKMLQDASNMSVNQAKALISHAINNPQIAEMLRQSAVRMLIIGAALIIVSVSIFALAPEMAAGIVLLVFAPMAGAGLMFNGLKHLLIALYPAFREPSAQKVFAVVMILFMLLALAVFIYYLAVA